MRCKESKTEPRKASCVRVKIRNTIKAQIEARTTSSDGSNRQTQRIAKKDKQKNKLTKKEGTQKGA